MAKYGPGPMPEGLTDPAAEALRRVLYGANSPCEVPDEPIVNTEQFFASGTLERGLEAPEGVRPLADPIAGRPALCDDPGRPPGPDQRAGLPPGQSRDAGRRRSPAGSSRSWPGPTASRSDAGAAGSSWPGRSSTRPTRSPRASWSTASGCTTSARGSSSRRATSARAPRRRAIPSCSTGWPGGSCADGWSLKALHRLIMLSPPTGSRPRRPRLRRPAADPENRLLWRMNVHRLTFEEIRDSLFAVAGELDGRIGRQAGRAAREAVLAPADGLRAGRPRVPAGPLPVVRLRQPRPAHPAAERDDGPAAGPLLPQSPAPARAGAGPGPSARMSRRPRRPTRGSHGSSASPIRGADAGPGRACDRPRRRGRSRSPPRRAAPRGRRPGRTATRRSTPRRGGWRTSGRCPTSPARSGRGARAGPTAASAGPA